MHEHSITLGYLHVYRPIYIWMCQTMNIHKKVTTIKPSVCTVNVTSVSEVFLYKHYQLDMQVHNYDDNAHISFWCSSRIPLSPIAKHTSLNLLLQSDQLSRTDCLLIACCLLCLLVSFFQFKEECSLRGLREMADYESSIQCRGSAKLKM